MRILVLLVIAALAPATACKRKVEEEQSVAPRRAEGAGTAAPADVGPTVTGPTPLPAATVPTLGRPGGVALHAAADDGSWVALCQDDGDVSRPWLQVAGSAAMAIDRLVASSDRDVLVTSRGRLLHVDVAARTRRDLGPVAHGAVDAGRRVVFARGSKLVILDPGKAPRELETGAPVGAVWLRGPRWAEVGSGEVPALLYRPDCGPLYISTGDFEKRTTVDLDPTGVEAVDRVGPEVSITPAGEISVDGEVVVDAACAGTVHAALATPPRVLVICKRGKDVVAGPGGFRVEIQDYVGAGSGEHAAISEHLILGQRLPCFSSACVDLWTGTSYAAGTSLVVASTTLLVRKLDDGSLRIDHLPPALDGTGRHAIIKLPRVTQAVTVDTVTGRRRVGAAPLAPSFVDTAGRWLLYGRHVIDLQDGVLVATLAEDALAIDELGRVLVPAAPGTGPLTWKKP